MSSYIIQISLILLILLIVVNYLILKYINKKTEFRARIFAQINIPIIVINNNHRITYWNKEAEDLYGYKLTDVIGKKFTEVVRYEEDKKIFDKNIYEEQIHYNKNKEEIYTQLSTNSVKDEKGEKIGTVIIVYDLTKRKKIEDDQRFLAQADIKILNSLDRQAIFKKTLTHAVPYISDWAAIDIVENGSPVLTSSVSRNIKKKSQILELHKILIEKDAPVSIPKSLEDHKSQLLSQVPKTYLPNRKNKYYKIFHYLSIKSLMIIPLMRRGKAIGAVTLVSTDSGRHFDESSLELAENLINRAAIAVDNAQLYLRAQEAIRTREEFLSLASHELKTPLTSLLLQLQIVLRSVSQDPLAKLSIERLLDLLKNAEQQSKKLADLIANLLNVSRITSGHLNLQREKVNLSQVVEKVVRSFSEQIKNENYQLNIINKDRIVGFWDPLQLEQVVTNLLSNAIKYGGGKPIEVKVEREGEEARLTVKDNGIGIDSKQKDHIFKPFSRASKNPEYQGLGVGLYIVHQIVEAHGGRIIVDSSPNKGSTFTVDFPIEKK